MRLQKSPNAWSCLPTAFAMAIGCPVENLIESIGHDGGEIVWPTLPEPMRRRGFHVQEIIAVLYQCGYSVTPIENECRIAPNKFLQPLNIDNRKTFDEVIRATRGILTGYTSCNVGHAVAYDHGVVLDPRRIIYPQDFTPICAWIVRSNH